MIVKFMTDREKQTFILVQVDNVVNVERIYRTEVEQVDDGGNIIAEFDKGSMDIKVVLRDKDYEYSAEKIVCLKRRNNDLLNLLTFCIDDNNKNVSWLSELPVYIMNDNGQTVEKLI